MQRDALRAKAPANRFSPRLKSMKSGCFVRLEGELQSELNEARVVDGGVRCAEAVAVLYCAVGRIQGCDGEVVYGQTELCMIPEVEELCAEVQSHFSGQRELLDEGEVRVDEVGTYYRNARGVSELTDGRSDEAGGIEVLVGAVIGGADVASLDDARPVPVIAVAAVLKERTRLVVAVDQRVGEAGGDSFNEGSLPVAEDLVGSLVPIASELAASAEGEIVDHA